jgi:hypothetical protein
VHDSLLKECARVEENSTYSAETHHIMAKRQDSLYNLTQLAPALAAAVMGTLTVGQVVPTWFGSAATVAAVVTAIGTVLNPQRSYFTHLSAAKAFTVMKHDARAARDRVLDMTADEATCTSVSLHDRYNDLVRISPPTEDWAFEKARKRVQGGVHRPDDENV